MTWSYRFFRATLYIACAVLLGCDAAADADGSDGTELPVWELIETLRIGSVEGGEYPLQTVTRLLPGPDGSVLVWQRTTPEVPEFGPDGHLRRVFGRSGSGPGELVAINGIGWLADTLWISDFQNQKLSYYSADGRHLSDERVEVGRVSDNPYLYRFPPHPLAGEWAIVMPGYELGMDTKIVLPIYKTDRTGSIADTLTRWDLETWRTLIERNGRASSVAKPFPLPLSTGISPGGIYFAMFTPADPNEGLRAAETGGRLTLLNADFDTVLDSELAAPLRRVPDDVVRERYAALAESLSDDEPEQARILRDLMEGITEPPFYALVDELLVADNGEVWLRRGYPDEGARTWWVVDMEGELQATVAVPAGVSLHAIASDAVWGVLTDDLGVPYLVRYELVRG